MKDWLRIQELFAEAADAKAEERARILRDRAGDRPAFLARVEALLSADAQASETFDGTAADLLAALRAEPPADELCGLEFGEYRIGEHLSSGGMGHVYTATRVRAGTRRRVALKVLRPALAGHSFLERFRRERETLARLEHENIVTFLDAGSLPDGRPFLVMELVDGVPLSEWGQGRTLPERLRLFLDVLSGVQYAHRALVVHCDLKPGNVLVTEGGVPKLLDFGIAAFLDLEDLPEHRALDEREAAPRGVASAVTGPWEVLPGPMTLPYASPEQRAGRRAGPGTPVETTSDVYALGVLLDELVSGESRPADASSSEVPDPASKGELGAIVARATEPDPAARYRSADRMASDLRRYLAHEPIEARPASWAYRARLWVRRNRWVVALTAAATLALGAGWIGADLRWRQARAEASLGWQAHAQARLTARVFERWIASTSSSDPRLAEDAAEHLEGALAEHLAPWPEAEALLRMTLAELYLERGETARARRHAERAVELVAEVRGIGPDDRERAQALLRRTRSDA